MSNFALDSTSYTTCGVFGGIGAAHIEKAYTEGGWIALLHCIVGFIEILPFIGWLIAFIDWCANPPKPATQSGQNPPGAGTPPPVNTAQPAPNSATAAQVSVAPPKTVVEKGHWAADQWLEEVRKDIGPHYAGVLKRVPLERAAFDKRYGEWRSLAGHAAYPELLSACKEQRMDPTTLQPPVLSMELVNSEGRKMEDASVTCLLLDVREFGEVTTFIFANDQLRSLTQLTDENTGYFVIDRTGTLLASRQASLLWKGYEGISLEKTLDPKKAGWTVSLPKKPATPSQPAAGAPAPAAPASVAAASAPALSSQPKPLSDGLQKALEEAREVIGRAMELRSRDGAFHLSLYGEASEGFRRAYNPFKPWKGTLSALLSLVRTSSNNGLLLPPVVRIPFGNGLTQTVLALGVVERDEGTVLVLSSVASFDAKTLWIGLACLAYDSRGKYLGALQRYNVQHAYIRGWEGRSASYPIEGVSVLSGMDVQAEEEIVLKALNQVGEWEVAVPKAPVSAAPATNKEPK